MLRAPRLVHTPDPILVYLRSCAAFSHVVMQSRVARELCLVTPDRRHADTEFPGTLASPATRLRFRFRGPDELQQVANACERIINSRVLRLLDHQFQQLAHVLVDDERLVASETREIKTIRTNAPRRRMCLGVKVDHRLVLEELARVENLILRLTRHAFLELEPRFQQSPCYDQNNIRPGHVRLLASAPLLN